MDERFDKLWDDVHTDSDARNDENIDLKGDETHTGKGKEKESEVHMAPT